jgi:glycosyltransferase involved in cell wall biosynthesis
MSEPRTSVVIPCYNVDHYLRAALDSVQNQTTPVREILLVDDGSKVPLSAPAAWQGPPLRLIRTENRGLAAARNLGTDHASGEFVAYLDADDAWHPDKIARQEQALAADAGAVAAFTRCVQAPGFYGFGPYPPQDVSERELLLVLWYNCFFPPSALLVRRTELLRLGKFREGMGNGEDIELYYRLLRAGRIVQVPEPLTYYRIHEQQFTRNVVRKMLGLKEARQAILDQHADRLVEAGLPKSRLWDAYRNDILLVYYRRDFASARKLLWDFWKDHPTDLKVLAYFLSSLLPAGLVTRLRGKLSQPSAAEGGSALQNPGAWEAAFRRIPLIQPSAS